MLMKWCLQSVKGAKTWEKAEDPIFALENNLPIDFQHYLEHHLSLPLMRIFEPIMRNPKSLLSGLPTPSPHARHTATHSTTSKRTACTVQVW